MYSFHAHGLLTARPHPTVPTPVHSPRRHRQTPGDALSDAGYRALNIVIGVAISAVVAFAIFPIKARSLLRKQTAVALMQAGDLAAWVFTQVGVEPTAKDSNALPHASGTDKSMWVFGLSCGVWGHGGECMWGRGEGGWAAPQSHMVPRTLGLQGPPVLASGPTCPACINEIHASNPHDHIHPCRRYIDDGLQVEMAPLFAATQRLAVSLAGLDDLLRSARAEVNLFSRPHRFPSKTYG